MDHRIARSIVHPGHVDGACLIHANSRTVRVAHRVRQRLRQESQSAIGGSAEQDIGVVGGIIFPHHIDVPGCVHRSLRSHREIAVVRHVLCCGERQLRLCTDAHGQQTQKCYGGDLAEAAGVNHETLLKRSTNKNLDIVGSSFQKWVELPLASCWGTSELANSEATFRYACPRGTARSKLNLLCVV